MNFDDFIKERVLFIKKHAGDDCDEMLEELYSISSMAKKAYPQGFGSNYIQSPYNMQKWVQSMREIYALNTRGASKESAFNETTKQWDEMERRNFKEWLNFYESGAQNDYKTAQNYYQVGEGAMLPAELRAKIPGISSRFPPRVPPFEDVQAIEDQRAQQIEQTRSNKEILDNKIKALIGRLNSAEKIFTSADFRKVLGQEHEPWLAALHDLKRKIQLVRSASTAEDLIIQSSNRLLSQGFKKSASLMYRLAQAPPGEASGESGETAPPGLDDPPEDIMNDLEGDSGGMDDMGEGGLGLPDEDSDGKDTSDPDEAMNQFLKNLGSEFEEEKPKEKESNAFIDVDEAFIVVSEDENDAIKLAQMPGGPDLDGLPNDKPEMPEADRGNPPMSESESLMEQQSNEKTDLAIEDALKNTTLEDVISKLEELSNLYKNRQLSRELTIVDLMMQALGISSYFPSMAEAAKSALDSNQYVLTRVEEIIARLRGAAAAESGTLDSVVDRLRNQDDHKSKRQEEKESATMGKEGPPEGEILEEVPGQPVPQRAPEGPPGPTRPQERPSPAREMAGPARVQPPGEGIRPV